jgi:hypothetical protein
MSAYSEKFEIARKTYCEQRDQYLVSYAEEDRIKMIQAFRDWLATSGHHVVAPRGPRKRILERVK